MNRGKYSSILQENEYKDAGKDWYVELEQYHMYWYDLLVNNKEVADYIDSRQLIVDYLKSLKINVEKSLEKRFIYFVCSRTKVRFDLAKKPRYNPFTKRVSIGLLIGAARKKVTIKPQFYDASIKDFSNPKVTLTEKYITITDSKGNLTTASIHDFLNGTNINIGIDTRVEYVGYTKNPHTRPTNGAHTGLSDALYRVSNEERDTLLFFNLFKVNVIAKNERAGLHMTTTNAMTNEIPAKREGEILEKSLLLYFDSENQIRNKAKERNELSNNLVKIQKENRINSVQFSFEWNSRSEYGRFYSSKVPADWRQAFTVKNVKGVYDIKKGVSIGMNFYN